MEAKTTWSKNGKNKTIPELQDFLIDIMRHTKQWHVPDENPTTAPQRVEMKIVGTLSNTVKRFRSKGKVQVYRVQQECAELMATERRDWRDQSSRENATTGEA